MINQFDKGEVVELTSRQHLRRAGYFLSMTTAALSGTLWAIVCFVRSPLDALVVLPIVFLTTSCGANTAYHMYFTHASFATGRAFRAVLALSGTLLCQDSIGQWVANHRRHHRHVDIAGKDPHTPLQFGSSPAMVFTLGLLWASAGWKFSRITASKRFYARTLMEDPVVAWFDRHFVGISFAGLWLPFVAGCMLGGPDQGLKAFAYFGGLRIFIGYFFTEFVTNGLCHSIGSRKFDIRGRSTNIALLSPLTFGATLHHNHHAFPKLLSPTFDADIDTMAPVYLLLTKVGVIDPEARPTDEEVEAKRLRSDD